MHKWNRVCKGYSFGLKVSHITAKKLKAQFT